MRPGPRAAPAASGAQIWRLNSIAPKHHLPRSALSVGPLSEDRIPMSLHLQECLAGAAAVTDTCAESRAIAGSRTAPRLWAGPSRSAFHRQDVT